MKGIQRYDIDTEYGDEDGEPYTFITEMSDGGYVKYDDAVKWKDAAVAAARQEEATLRAADASNGVGHWLECAFGGMRVGPTGQKAHDVTSVYLSGYADGARNERVEAKP